MFAQLAPAFIDDIARRVGIGAQFLDQAGIVAVGHETDVLAVGLARDAQADLRGDFAHLRLGHAAERKAQEIELRRRGREQEIALVARRIGALVQFRPLRSHHPPDIMAGGEAIGAKIAGEREQIGEFRPHIAFDAGNGRASGEIFVGEIVDHRVAKAAFMVEHIMRDAQPIAHRARVANVAARATAARPAHRLAMVVELQRDADRFRPGPRRQRRDHRTVDAARHGDDDPPRRNRAVELKIAHRENAIVHRRAHRVPPVAMQKRRAFTALSAFAAIPAA